MISRQKHDEMRSIALKMLENNSIALTEQEKLSIEVADFDLGRVEEIGLQLVTYINTSRCCAKDLVLIPWQICPEHIHPPVHGDLGKEETFRCRAGEVYLYVEGEPTPKIKGKIPEDKKEYFTVFHEIVLKPGEQYTLPPNTHHWFQAGKDGCIVSEFSTTSRDDLDIFTDPEIVRAPEIEKGD